MKKQLKLLLVDFDGVLNNGRFYRPDPEQSKMGKMASETIFYGKAKMEQVNRREASQLHIDVLDHVE